MSPASDIALTLRDSEPIANRNFAAVLLAGGRSSRMGRDKAALIIDGQPLWQLQLAKLRALQPVELFISGRRDGPFADAGVEILEDAVPSRGPLSGIAATFARMRSDRVLVLAIDLPAITVDFLRGLVAERGSVIPQRGDFFEPLAAIYPQAAATHADAALAGHDHSMQRFCRALVAERLAVARPLTPKDEPLFRNLNEPRDLPLE